MLLIAAGLLWPLLFNFDEAMLPDPLVLDIPDADSAVEKVKQSPGFAEHKSIDRAEVSGASKKPDLPVKTSTEPASAGTTQAKTTENSPAPKINAIGQASIAETESTPHLDNRGVPVAYVVQVATFGNWNNADRMRNDLIKSEYKAYTRPETSSQTGPYRVLVGPLLTYADAKQASEEIKEQYRISDTFIRRFGRR